ncbi:MAG: exodeoxyribonuclease VII large subunit, partial [Acetobacteraceae bacterium]|nr:exodeoxyribonuclease VII large subunit [Acetobacteraceae bacterium]
SALHRAERAIPDLPAMIAAARQRLGDRALRLILALPNLLALRRGEMERMGRLPPPAQAIAARRAALHLASAHITGGLRRTVAAVGRRAGLTLARLTDAPLRGALRESHARLDGMAARLESVSPDAVLKRGYALVFDRAGHPVTVAASVRPGDPLRLRFADGEAAVVAEGGAAGRQGRLPL